MNFYSSMSIEGATGAYCEDCARYEEIADEIYDRTPDCDVCGGKVDLEDGYHEFPVKIKGHIHNVIICASCAEDYFYQGDFAEDELGIAELKEAM